MDRPIEIEKQLDDCSYVFQDNDARSFLFIGETHALLVDTGRGKAGSLRALIEPLTDKPIILVITHADNDHIGNNAEFDAVPHMHPSEMPDYFQKVGDLDAPVDPLWEGDVIDIGGRTFEVLHIPGHTPGSIAILDRKNRFLLTGDSVTGTRPSFLCGAQRSFYPFIASLEKLVRLQNTYDTIYAAHGALPLPATSVNQTLAAAKKFVEGERPTPLEPPPEFASRLAATPGVKMYEYDGATFFF